MRDRFMLFLSEMRVKQWTKNFLVYAAPMFNGTLFNPSDFTVTSAVFFAFCMSGSGIYIINDVYDIDKDRLNPSKCSRPLAAGKIAVAPALACSAISLLAGFAVSLTVNISCFCILASYVLINILYTLRLKHAVIIDVMIIAYGFVARAVCGAAASGVKMTTWFVMCVMFLSLFLALGKRRCELAELQSEKIPEGRDVLKYYSIELIDHLMNITTSGLIMSYALFTMDSSTRNSQAMAVTIPIVVYGIFYYLYIVHVKKGGGSPDEELYKEKPILAAVVIYVLMILFIRSC